VITRGVLVKLLAFALVSVVGVSFVAVRYLGLGDRVLGGAYLVHAEFTEAGGIFPNASVNYRGVPVGRVAAVALDGELVRVDLRLDRDVRVPADTSAVVALRSAVGEQYVDLRPQRDGEPYLQPGDTIPVGRTGTPLPVETLLVNLHALVDSVGPDDVQVLIDELGTGFAGNERALRQLLDAHHLLLAEADRHLPDTSALISDGGTVLATQAESAEAIGRWAAGLAELAAALREADPDLRGLLAHGPPAAVELTGLLHDLDPSIGMLLGDLITVNGIAMRRLAGIEHALVAYPLAVAGGYTVAPGDGTAHLGLVANADDPPPCQYQQTGTERRCTAEEIAQGSGVRGVHNAPRPGGSEPASSPLWFGASGGQHALAGDQSWKLLLYSGVSP
jgi:phospholipid/cholesterol/gamma-HCH transport system substrate-binding protein